MKRRLGDASLWPMNAAALRFAGCYLGAWLMLMTGPLALRGGDIPAAGLRFRLAVSEGLIGAEVNERDATLAMQVWRDAVFKQSGLFIDFNVTPLPKLVRAVRDHQVEGFSITMLEYLEVEKYAGQILMTGESNVKEGDEYLLLVHEDSGIHTVADLRRKSLNVFDNPKMSLAKMWLTTVLSSSSLGPPEELLDRMSIHNKASSVVLPVYFRQSDACLVTRRAFSTMCELNPQLGRKLRVIASSPRMVTTLMGFHKDCPPELRQKFQNALLGLNKTVAGQQALTLFESSQLVVSDSSVLKSALDVAREHDRIRDKKK